MRQSTVTAAFGRWREILPALGLPEALFNGKHQPCPLCGGKDRFRYSDPTGNGGYFCSQCGSGPGIKLLMKYQGWDFKRAASEVDRIIGNGMFNGGSTPKLVSLRDLYDKALPVEDGNAAGCYLAARGIPGPYPKVLRYVPSMKHSASGTTHPGMLAVFAGEDGKAASMQRTYLTGEGRKADLEGGAKLNLYGRPMPAGGAIRLGPIKEVMGIAEGVETAMSASVLFAVTCWATTSDQLLAQWKPPAEVKRVIIFSDSDSNFAGQAAAYALAKRLIMESGQTKIERAVEVMIPPGKDYNDVLMMQRSKAG
jgi:putative DNA primase/helicase